MAVTTIQVKDSTLKKLKGFKVYDRESYDKVINDLMNQTEVEILTEEDIKEIEQGLADVKAGRIYSEEDIAKEFGVKLKY